MQVLSYLEFVYEEVVVNVLFPKVQLMESRKVMALINWSLLENYSLLLR